MTVADLIALLQQVPQEATVYWRQHLDGAKTSPQYVELHGTPGAVEVEMSGPRS